MIPKPLVVYRAYLIDYDIGVLSQFIQAKSVNGKAILNVARPGKFSSSSILPKNSDIIREQVNDMLLKENL